MTNAMSVLCHERKKPMSFDHSVRTPDQSWLDFDAECVGSFQIDHQLEYRRAFDWQLSLAASMLSDLAGAIVVQLGAIR
jgi:hypothetical protein